MDGWLALIGITASGESAKVVARVPSHPARAEWICGERDGYIMR